MDIGWGSYIATILNRVIDSLGYLHAEPANFSSALQVNRNQNSLLTTIAAISTFDGRAGMTLNEALDNFKLKWILLHLDVSLREVGLGQKTINQHKSFASSKIKMAQQCSLHYHPDKKVDVNPAISTKMQRQVNDIVKALRNIQDYVMSTQTHPVSYIYRLFGDISIDLLTSGKDLGRIVNISVYSKWYDIAYWAEGKLMECRNLYLEKVSAEAVKIKVDLACLLGNIERENIVLKIKEVYKRMDSDKTRYRAEYFNSWLSNLKNLSNECRYKRDLEMIQSEVNQLCKDSENQYKLLGGHKRSQVCDETFVKPIVDYSVYFRLCSCAITYLKNEINDKTLLGTVKKDKFFDKDADLTKKVKEHLEGCEYEEYFYLMQLLVDVYVKEKKKDYLLAHILFKNQNNQHTNVEVQPSTGNCLFGGYRDIEHNNKIHRAQIRYLCFLALQKFPNLLIEQFKRKETFFEREKKREEQLSREYEEMKRIIEDIEAQNRDLETKIGEEVAAKERAESIMECTKEVSQMFTLKIRRLEMGMFDAIVNSQPQIVQAIAGFCTQHSCSSADVLSHVFEEILINKASVMELNSVSNEMVENALEKFKLNVLDDAYQDFGLIGEELKIDKLEDIDPLQAPDGRKNFERKLNEPQSCNASKIPVQNQDNDGHPLQASDDINMRDNDLHPLQESDDKDIQDNDRHPLPDDKNMQDDDKHLVPASDHNKLQGYDKHLLPVSKGKIMQDNDIHLLPASDDVNIQDKDKHISLASDDENNPVEEPISYKEAETAVPMGQQKIKDPETSLQGPKGIRNSIYEPEANTTEDNESNDVRSVKESNEGSKQNGLTDKDNQPDNYSEESVDNTNFYDSSPSDNHSLTCKISSIKTLEEINNVAPEVPMDVPNFDESPTVIERNTVEMLKEISSDDSKRSIDVPNFDDCPRVSESSTLKTPEELNVPKLDTSGDMNSNSDAAGRLSDKKEESSRSFLEIGNASSIRQEGDKLAKRGSRKETTI